MPEELGCDICGRSESELFLENPEDTPVLETDADGLWTCRDCRARLKTQPATQMPVQPEDSELANELQPLVGKSAGAICQVLELPYAHPYNSIIDHADIMQVSLKSAWLFVTQWQNGTTIWEPEEGNYVAMVTPEGKITIQSR